MRDGRADSKPERESDVGLSAIDGKLRCFSVISSDFVQHHRVMRGDDLVMQCEEVRVFARRREDGGIAAVPVPPGIRAALG